MMRSICKIVGKLRREKTDNETLKAIKSLSLPTTAEKVAKRLGINRKSTMNRIRRLEVQGKVYRKSKNGNSRYFLIYLGSQEDSLRKGGDELALCINKKPKSL